MSVSLDRALLLLSVVEKAAAHGTQYAAMIGSCGAELDEMNKIAQKDINERAKVAAEAAAKAKAEEEAKAKTEEEKASAPTSSPAPIVRRPIAEQPNVS